MDTSRLEQDMARSKLRQAAGGRGKRAGKASGHEKYHVVKSKITLDGLPIGADYIVFAGKVGEVVFGSADFGAAEDFAWMMNWANTERNKSETPV